jgi:hypothetical protein
VARQHATDRLGGAREHQVVAGVKPVDLDDQDVQLGQVRCHPLGQPLGGQRHEPARSRRLRGAVPGDNRQIALRKPNSAPELARRYVDQHQVHGPAAKPILGLRRRPGRQCNFVAIETARLHCLVNGTLPWPWIDAEKALPWVEQRIHLTLAETQKTAVRLSLMTKVLVITGGPGVGKTAIVNAILRILSAKGMKIRLCAPTGRAARRMSETTGMEVRTIHRLLEVDPRTGGFKRGEESTRL